MKFEQTNAHEALRHVQKFMDINNDRLAEVNAGGARTALNDSVQKIEELASQQDPTRLQRDKELEQELAVRKDLRETLMKPIARVAQLKLRAVKGFEQLRLPDKSVNTPTLVRWGREMAKAAEPYRDTFVAHGLASDFSSKLLAKADEVQNVMDTRWHVRSKAVGATNGLREEVRHALGILGVIDALVVPKVAGDSALIREWRFAKKVVRRATRAIVAEAAPATPESVPTDPAPTQAAESVPAVPTPTQATDASKQKTPAPKEEQA